MRGERKEKRTGAEGSSGGELESKAGSPPGALGLRTMTCGDSDFRLDAGDTGAEPLPPFILTLMRAGTAETGALGLAASSSGSFRLAPKNHFTCFHAISNPFAVSSPGTTCPCIIPYIFATKAHIRHVSSRPHVSSCASQTFHLRCFFTRLATSNAHFHIARVNRSLELRERGENRRHVHIVDPISKIAHTPPHERAIAPFGSFVGSHTGTIQALEGIATRSAAKKKSRLAMEVRLASRQEIIRKHGSRAFYGHVLGHRRHQLVRRIQWGKV